MSIQQDTEMTNAPPTHSTNTNLHPPLPRETLYLIFSVIPKPQYKDYEIPAPEICSVTSGVRPVPTLKRCNLSQPDQSEKLRQDAVMVKRDIPGNADIVRVEFSSSWKADFKVIDASMNHEGAHRLRKFGKIIVEVDVDDVDMSRGNDAREGYLTENVGLKMWIAVN